MGHFVATLLFRARSFVPSSTEGANEGARLGAFAQERRTKLQVQNPSRAPTGVV
jgi:hypothetical protein